MYEYENDEAKIFPTLKKISSTFFNDLSNSEKLGFNHHMIYLGDASINTMESGRSFFESITNQADNEMRETEICFNFRFAHYRGIFNNIFGEFDFVKLLTVSAAQDKVSNQKVKFFQAMKDGFIKAGKDTLKLLKTRAIHQPDKFLNANTVIGNALNNITDPNFLVKMVKNTADLGITMGEDWINSGLAKANNLVQQNFSDNFITSYKDFFPKTTTNIGLVETPEARADSPAKSSYAPDSIRPNIEKGIRLGNSNIYDRTGF